MPAAAPAGILIESPMVGTYYASSAPDTPPFVSIGAHVHPDATICVIEAMKVFTEIPAGVSGTITAVLVQNGQPVEYGQPLFRVNPD
jgi:acetyl-CoA carboxylase biotin carboxyl carrier protein